jgi:ribosomal protein S18 acetylase RimI-like enzyme
VTPASGMIASMIEEPTIREGRPGDVEAMAWARSEGQREEWRRHLARGQAGEVDFLVIEIGGRVVGKAVLDWTHNPDGTPWLWLGSVDPDYRSQGLGALGLAEAERRVRARGHAVIEMCVDDDNPRARDLYLRSGYAVVGPYLDEHDETLCAIGSARSGIRCADRHAIKRPMCGRRARRHP